MNKKSNKNLTSKQRRELRQNETVKQPVKAEEPLNAQETEGGETAVKQSMNPRKRLFIIIGVIIAEAIIIFLAIFLPIAISPYRKIDNPVAVITLSNGYELEFEIYEEKVPFAATNFIYLAKNKFFDGAIIYDMQNQFMRFGGFRDELFTHRSDDLNYAKKLTDIAPRDDGRKLVYRLKKDTDLQAKNTLLEGYLSFISDSSTEFQLCTGEGASLQDGNGGTVSGVSFARYLSPETLEKIHSMYSSVYPDNSSGLVHSSQVRSGFLLPDKTIKIEKIKLYNLDKDKWRDFDYGQYLKDNSLDYWIG